MLLSLDNQKLIRRIAAKESTLFFSSPIAYLFLAVFAGVTLFVFFWGQSFFSRNIADVRPLFESMPILLIFLCSTLTMRLWSEERRSGTLEHVLTQPVSLWQFVLGKYVGCLGLLAIALVVTLPLPVSVSIIGNLDWGPVIAGYLATFLLGAAYLAIGLFVSAKSDNQIVSLILATALCGLFYLVGTSTVTEFFGYEAGEWLRLLGTGSRFDQITRGVIDFRDLYYYLSIIAVFLVLNTYVLERERWAHGHASPLHHSWRNLTLLLIANFLGANLWLGQINSLRVDATEGNIYSISDATHNYLDRLQEPLLIRGYFSAKTHPFLAPLVPQLRDLIHEYEIAGKGQVRVEFIDPADNPELEQEANQKYGIQPVPFQVADRYQASIVSSYFNVLIQYGDEHKVLAFSDLIEVNASGQGDVDVQLRNPEHDLTRAIKSVLNSYQAGGNLFDTVKGELSFVAYISADNHLPEELVQFKQDVRASVKEVASNSRDRLKIEFLDPDANDGRIAQQIAADYGFSPMAANIFSQNQFYFYLTLQNDNQVVQIPVEDMEKESFARNLDAAIKRFAAGFTKTVALVKPKQEPNPYAQYGMPPPTQSPQFRQLESFLSQNVNVVSEDLSDGNVSGQADILFLAAPKDLSEKELFAVDQFLMQGGTVIASTSPYSANISQKNLSLQTNTSGLENWLNHNGLTIEKQLVLDTQSSPFPLPVERNINGFRMQEMRMLDYPYFLDIRDKRFNPENPIVSELPQITMPWASPITVDMSKNVSRKVTELFRSSDASWVSSSTDVIPNLASGQLSQFTPAGEQKSRLLGVIAEGKFESYFKGKTSPLLSSDALQVTVEETTDEETNGVESADAAEASLMLDSVIDHSTESARIIVLSSNDMLRDSIVQLSSMANQSEYLNTLQLAANTVDWSLEDASLMSIRSRGNFNRTLPPMEQNRKMFWEYLNYGLAALALVIIALVQMQRKRSRQRTYAKLLEN
ncbi:hypothetical protein TDB9533_02758 [Thalassocella blandensis]|nr:hypothetical protein TDB9533_02758 [Thalassocella blandensis]